MRRLPSPFLHSSPPTFRPTQTVPSASFPKIPSQPRVKMSTNISGASPRRRTKVVVVMGATGCGKSNLSIELASRFFPQSEIINSDKIQIYRGLDITTNKMPSEDRRGVRHHLLGDSDASEITPSDFRLAASAIISKIASRRRVPFVVGGSNSFVYALLARRFDPGVDVFGEEEQPFCRELRYNCCFIWVDVFQPVLNRYLCKRVDEMLDSGMLDELAEYFRLPEEDRASRRGLNQAIGVPEFEKYFNSGSELPAAYDEAVRAIKDNTCQLSKRQVGKILRLRDEGSWRLNRVDATASLRAKMETDGRRRAGEIFEKEVVEPSMKIVKEFLAEG